MAIYIDDRQLVAAHQAGDSEAFDELVREYRQPLIAHAQRKLQCASAAEDAFQETLVRAYRALPNFEGEYRLGPWLHRIMANVCIDEANRRSRDGEKIQNLVSQPAARRLAPSPEDVLGLGIDDPMLDVALDALPETQKEALRLRFIEDLEYDQVAAISGVSEQNARARVSRARAAMRSAMKGCAALPVLLLGVLKKGEKAAAAAGNGSVIATGAAGSTAATVAAQAAPAVTALPTLAEASTAVAQAAPAAMPVIAKAAVGLGLAAAILTPTSDSAIHLGAEAVSQPFTVVISAPSELEVQSVENDLALSNGEVAVVNRETFENKMSAAMESSGNELTSGTAAVEMADLPVKLLGSNMEFIAVGGDRYDVRGDITIQTDSVAYVGTVESSSRLRLIVDSSDVDVMRAEMTLSFMVPEWGLTDMRVSGIISETDAASQFVGFFRSSTSAGDVLLEQGSISGEIAIDPQGSMALKLTP